MNAENPLLVDTGRGFSVFYKKRHLYNTKTPLESAERKAENFTVLPGTVVLVPSPVLFYGIDRILKNLPENCILIALETDPALFSLYNECGLSLPEDARFTYTSTLEKAVSAVSSAGIHRFRRVSTVSLSGGYLLDRKTYSDIRNRIEGILKEYWQNRMTSIHMSPLWIRNIFFNLYEITSTAGKRTFWDFTGFEDNRTVLVTGAGESLEDSLEIIKTYRKDIAVLAVDTAVSTLLKSGIIPDYIIAVDAQVFNYFDFIGLKNSHIPLFFDITCYPPIVRNFKGTLVPFLSNFSSTALIDRIKHAFPELKLIPPLGSVGITAVYIALLLTGGSVIHTGLDFSYSLGKYHAIETPFITELLSSSGRFRTVEDMDLYFKRPFNRTTDKNGKECITNTILASYAAVMNNYFSGTSRLFDLGGKGIPSAGHRIKSLKEVPGHKTPGVTKKTIFKSASSENTGMSSFLQEELERIENLYDDLYAFLSGAGIENNPEFHLDLMDYLHMHFPDFPPATPSSPDYIKRVLVSAGHYRRIISGLLSITL